MDEASFATAVTAAFRHARAQQRIESGNHDRRRLVQRLAALTPQIFTVAADASEGALRYKVGTFGSYGNDLHSLHLIRPNGHPCTLHVILIGLDRAEWQIVENIEVAGGLLTWMTLDELRGAEAFLKARVLELVNRFARGAEITTGSRF